MATAATTIADPSAHHRGQGAEGGEPGRHFGPSCIRGVLRTEAEHHRRQVGMYVHSSCV